MYRRASSAMTQVDRKFRVKARGWWAKGQAWAWGTVVLLFLAGVWQLAAVLSNTASPEGSPLVPGWPHLVSTALPALANYGGEGFGIDPTEVTYGHAFAAIAAHSADTWLRLLAGLFLGAAGGVLLGLGVSWSVWSRRLIALPSHILRTMPLLAMIPLFQLWFGISFLGIVIFVAYGIGVIFFAGVVNAVSNVPHIYIDNARTLGASRARIYTSVIIPAIIPELRSSIMLSLGVAWGAVLGAEFLGAQSGLGYIVVNAQLFSLLDRMIVVAILFIIYAGATYIAFELASRRLIAWHPGRRT